MYVHYVPVCVRVRVRVCVRGTVNRRAAVCTRVYASTLVKNPRSYREMLQARYDHRLLLLVLPEILPLFLSLSISLSPPLDEDRHSRPLFHSLSMIALPFNASTYLDRRNMPAQCAPRL